VKHENVQPTGSFKVRGQLTVITNFTDAEISRDMRLFTEKTHTLVEGAGASPLAAALKIKSSIRGKKVVLVATGANASTEALRAALS
jgi:threonine dehydratase